MQSAEIRPEFNRRAFRHSSRSRTLQLSTYGYLVGRMAGAASAGRIAEERGLPEAVVLLDNGPQFRGRFSVHRIQL